MLELTKAQTIKGYVDFSLRVPEAEATRVQEALKAILALADRPEFEDHRSYTPEEVFGPKSPGRLVRGARAREGWTQEELASRLETSRSVVCDIETGRRGVSIGMAKRLSKVFGGSHTVFL